MSFENADEQTLWCKLILMGKTVYEADELVGLLRARDAERRRGVSLESIRAPYQSARPLPAPAKDGNA
jgi:hypothetical protein